jgi:hypothetical protein
MKPSPVPDSVLRHFKDSRSLISFQREEIESTEVQGFILDFTDSWIMLFRVYDFTPDGLFIFRRSDLSYINNRATDAFQQGLLQDEGVINTIDFDQSFGGSNISSYIESLDESKVVIFEDEKEEDFLIGTGVQTHRDDENEVYFSLDFFTGAARYEEERSEIYLQEVSLICINTNYTLYYERYLKRQKLPL